LGKTGVKWMSTAIWNPHAFGLPPAPGQRYALLAR
jgi:hypothetical protein